MDSPINVADLEITTRRPEGKRPRWVARLTTDHPDTLLARENDLVAGTALAFADTEAELMEELARQGFARDDAGAWTFTNPHRSHIEPYTDPDGVARLGPV